jgi:hypothetical protein
MDTMEVSEPLTNTLEKPASCEYCRGTNLKMIIHGFPSRAQKLEINQGKAVLGNYAITDNIPHWHCNDCGHQFSQEMDPDFKELQELEENRFPKKSSGGCGCGNSNKQKTGSCCANKSA